VNYRSINSKPLLQPSTLYKKLHCHVLLTSGNRFSDIGGEYPAAWAEAHEIQRWSSCHDNEHVMYYPSLLLLLLLDTSLGYMKNHKCILIICLHLIRCTFRTFQIHNEGQLLQLFYLYQILSKCNYVMFYQIIFIVGFDSSSIWMRPII
jgi:hypothetical protein